MPDAHTAGHSIRDSAAAYARGIVGGSLVGMPTWVREAVNAASEGP
jgi:hypothetical protein